MIKVLEILVNRALHRNFLSWSCWCLMTRWKYCTLVPFSFPMNCAAACSIADFSGSQALSLARKEEDKYCASCFFLAIYEVGGVPFSVLEPVLEKCTPEQLYRIEECNHVSAWVWGRDADVWTWIDVLRDKEMKV